MTVGKLKQLLEGLDDEMLVLIPTTNEFTGEFYSPCNEESGVGEMGIVEEVEVTTKEFMLVPCGFFEEKDHSHELN